ncbi:hypothetical protein HPB50_007581 [Hyalomma asiaticum]|uniref:Uncharacterized protein n=1 Tax=Hyalomma asiaticum TaxID=266040 RepID=A0ACB7SM22_HYAAI|nr:hypothetical protein HPB50_007581 [Hyalomma asiaticum]
MGQAAGFVSAADFVELDEKEYQEDPIADPKSTVLAVCYTSGTTGKPKGALMTHYNYVHCFHTTRFIMPFSEEDLFLAVNPITHQTGMLYATITVLAGGTNIMMPVETNSREIIDAVEKYKVMALQSALLMQPLHRQSSQS